MFFSLHQSSIGHSSFHPIFPPQGWGSYGSTVCLSVFLPVPVVGADSEVSYRPLIKCTPIPLVSNHSTPVWTTMCSHWALLYCAVIKKSWILFKYRAFCPKPLSACGCKLTLQGCSLVCVHTPASSKGCRKCQMQIHGFHFFFLNTSLISPGMAKINSNELITIPAAYKEGSCRQTPSAHLPAG